MRPVFWILALSTAMLPLPLGQCGADDDDTTDLQWYTTCGDPVCRGYMPQDEIPLCSDQKEGSPCNTEGMMCDPQDECNAMMICATEDPKTGGCPISRRSYKEDIQYLGAPELNRYHQELMDVKLATYRYKGQSAETPERLGFIIDDREDSPAVLPSKERVDLYGYTSMAVAALQVQSKQIETLQQEVEKLKKELEATEKTSKQCK